MAAVEAGEPAMRMSDPALLGGKHPTVPGREKLTMTRRRRRRRRTMIIIIIIIIKRFPVRVHQTVSTCRFCRYKDKQLVSV